MNSDESSKNETSDKFISNFTDNMTYFKDTKEI